MTALNVFFYSSIISFFYLVNIFLLDGDFCDEINDLRFDGNAFQRNRNRLLADDEHEAALHRRAVADHVLKRHLENSTSLNIFR